MSKARAVQTSIWPEIQPDKPVGPILPSVFTGTNADLMVVVAPYYLTGHVLDATYGEGGCWRRFRPDLFDADTFDASCFDPPYIPQGGDTLPRSAGCTFTTSSSITPAPGPEDTTSSTRSATVSPAPDVVVFTAVPR